MTDTPLFYRSVAALDRDTHAGLRMRSGPPPLGFAKDSHLVPAVTDEFPAACRELPILFVATASGPSPVFLTGTRPGENHFVGPDGTWRGAYLPAYLRRYPFIKGEVAGHDPIVLVDAGAEIFQDGTEPLFEAGEPTTALRERVDLVNGYAEAAIRTEALARRLAALALLKEVNVDIRRPDGTSSTIHGLQAVDEARLNALPDADFLPLREGGGLAAIHAHLLSLAAVERLAGRSADSAERRVPPPEPRD